MTEVTSDEAAHSYRVYEAELAHWDIRAPVGRTAWIALRSSVPKKQLLEQVSVDGSAYYVRHFFTTREEMYETVVRACVAAVVADVKAGGWEAAKRVETDLLGAVEAAIEHGQRGSSSGQEETVPTPASGAAESAPTDAEDERSLASHGEVRSRRDVGIGDSPTLQRGGPDPV